LPLSQANTRSVSYQTDSDQLLGYKLALKQLRAGTSKLMIIANNCPAVRKTELEYLAILGGSKVLHWDGNNVELGTAAGRLHRVCVLTIQDAGDSDILTAI
jgi:large subunit ribosomal protein L30e